MSTGTEHYYRRNLARIHHLGFGFHAEECAPGVLRLLEPVLAHSGLVVELGCGSGLLTRHLIDAGHRVVATDASPDMLDLARTVVPDAEEIRRLVLPDDAIPPADAIVSVGHVLSYLASEDAIDRALIAIASALRPDGVLAIDLCDLEWGAARVDQPPVVMIEDDWALFTRRSVPAPDRYVREMTTFLREDDGSWRRDDERHDNVLIDTSGVPDLLGRYGVRADVRRSFGGEELPDGLRTIVGHRGS
jgi:SAM-dependent methyltransferase